MATSTIPTIAVQPRPRTGSRESQRLRKSGQLPVVIYGHGEQPVHGSVDYREFTDALRNGAHLVEVAYEGTTASCLVKDLQWNYLGNALVHADLTRVDLSEKVTVTVELLLKGEAPGLKEASTYMEHPVTELQIACRADSIPEHIEVDVSGLGVGDILYASALTLPEGVELVSDGDLVLAHVAVAAAVEEEAEEEEAAEVEPEVIGRKEEEEQEADAEK